LPKRFYGSNEKPKIAVFKTGIFLWLETEKTTYDYFDGFLSSGRQGGGIGARIRGNLLGRIACRDL
jgi:hypothetical protein